jgi:hypothetical protein
MVFINLVGSGLSGLGTLLTIFTHFFQLPRAQFFIELINTVPEFTLWLMHTGFPMHLKSDIFRPIPIGLIGWISSALEKSTRPAVSH